MARKKVFPNEKATKPGVARPKLPEVRRSGPAPKTKRELSEAPTLPPPPPDSRDESPARRPIRGGGAESKSTSGMRSRKLTHPSATVDEVTADLSKDPRREVDDE